MDLATSRGYCGLASFPLLHLRGPHAARAVCVCVRARARECVRACMCVGWKGTHWSQYSNMQYYALSWQCHLQLQVSISYGLLFLGFPKGGGLSIDQGGFLKSISVECV